MTIKTKLNLLAAILGGLSCATAARAQFSTIAYTGAIQTFTVPATGLYKITAYGAQGGNGYYNGGFGAGATGVFLLNSGTTVDVVVGGQGGSYNAVGYGGGGGPANGSVSPGGGGGAGWLGAGSDGTGANNTGICFYTGTAGSLLAITGATAAGTSQFYIEPLANSAGTAVPGIPSGKWSGFGSPIANAGGAQPGYPE